MENEDEVFINENSVLDASIIECAILEVFISDDSILEEIL